MSVGHLKQVSKTKLSYLADACISFSQVFLGIAAALAFLDPFDIIKLPVVLSTVIMAATFLMIGWRILK